MSQYFYRQASLLTFILAALFIQGELFARGDDFPPPPGSQVQWVSKSMVLNGVPMSVRHFKTDKSMDHVLRYYRQFWRIPVIKNLPGYMEAGTGPWQLITRLEEGRFLSVQVQPVENGKGSWGYLGESKGDRQTLDAVLNTGDGFPKMSRSQVINDLRSSDAGLDGRTLLIANSFSARANASYYRDHYVNGGWEPLVDRETNATWVQTFQRGREQVSLTIRSDNGVTVVVANQTKRGLF